MEAQLALGGAPARPTSSRPARRRRRSAAVERLWRELRLDRGGTIVALGGGCTTDTAGFAAATYLRGIDWVAVPTTLVGQVDAAIGGKTAIDLPGGKNLVGAFHWPVRTIIDPALLDTLPEAELRERPRRAREDGPARGRAALGAAARRMPCAPAPPSRPPSASATLTTAATAAQLNLGHTFAHALEAAAGYGLPHGRAVALGLLAALRLSGLATTDVERELRARAGAGRPRARLGGAGARQEGRAGRPQLVLLEAPGTSEARRRAAGGRRARRTRLADRGIESARARGSAQRRQPRRARAARSGAVRRARPRGAREPHLRVVEGARVLDPLPADEPRGPVRRLVSRRPRLGRRSRGQPGRVVALQLRDP